MEEYLSSGLRWFFGDGGFYFMFACTTALGIYMGIQDIRKRNINEKNTKNQGLRNVKTGKLEQNLTLN